jgi:hypothetical protein
MSRHFCVPRLVMSRSLGLRSGANTEVFVASNRASSMAAMLDGCHSGWVVARRISSAEDCGPEDSLPGGVGAVCLIGDGVARLDLGCDQLAVYVGD